MSDEERAREILAEVLGAQSMYADAAGWYHKQNYVARRLAAERERCENVCADIMQKHRADRQRVENDPEMWEEFWMAKSAEDSAKDCALAIRALGEEG